MHSTYFLSPVELRLDQRLLSHGGTGNLLILSVLINVAGPVIEPVGSVSVGDFSASFSRTAAWLEFLKSSSQHFHSF